MRESVCVGERERLTESERGSRREGGRDRLTERERGGGGLGGGRERRGGESSQRIA